MSKPWVGYLSAVFLLLAGVLQFLGGNPKIGVLFMVLSVVSVCVKIYIARKQNSSENEE